MNAVVFTGIFTLFFWGLFIFFFEKDRSRYRNCYLLFLAIMSMIPFALNIGGQYSKLFLVVFANLILIAVLIVPFFLIYNGIVMIRKEGRQLAHMLSLGLGIIVFIGETLFYINIFSGMLAYKPGESGALYHSIRYIAGAYISVSVIYGSMAFVIFMIYTLFLQIIPRRKDFDYVIIHGAGLIGGERVSKLLQDRLDKAIEVYRRDKPPPKLIPSGGKGSDESLSEAEAMKNYLVEQGIPEEDIIMEDQSKTTFENLKFSKDILDSMEGRKYTALVTSNYHVYRALRYCKQVGLKCTGIGSRVAFYYWPSALIREFIAIHAEKKHAVIFVAGWAACMILTYIVMI